jgi:hypothetical protein
VREVRTGVSHWEARHPEWHERQWWGPLVSSYAIDDGARLLLFDPLAPPAEIENLAEERETAIVLTCPWHRRDGCCCVCEPHQPQSPVKELRSRRLTQ